MTKTAYYSASVLLDAIVLPAPHAQTTQIGGFTAQKAAWERSYEASLKALPDPAVCRRHSTALSQQPTLVDSDWDWWNAQYSLEAFRFCVLEAELKTYYVYMSLPKAIQVEMVAPTSYTAKTKENGWPWRQHFEDVVVGYNAYSPSGDVTAELVYVNYGIPEDGTLYLFDYPGDPLTAGWAATQGAHRIDPQIASNLPHAVPTVPLSYGEAEPLLRAVGGRAAPSGWQGGLPFTYRVGPGPAKVHLKLDIDYQIKPIWDTVFKIPGTNYPDQWVVLGAHRDGWTYGSSDSVSGFGCHTVWINDLIRSAAVAKVPVQNGLVYIYNFVKGPGGDDGFYFTAVDFHTGQTVFQRLIGQGFPFASFASIHLGPDGKTRTSGSWLDSLRFVTPSEPERITLGTLLTKETSYETIKSSRSGDDDFPPRLHIRGCGSAAQHPTHQ